MPTFAFSGRTRTGQTITGERVADTMDAAVALLRREQIQVTRIDPTKVKAEAKAAAPGGKVLIVESVIPEGDQPHPGKWLDLIMLSVPAGRERTATQYKDLLSAAGLRLTRIVPTQSPVSVVEAVVA